MLISPYSDLIPDVFFDGGNFSFDGSLDIYIYIYIYIGRYESNASYLFPRKLQ